MASTPTYDEAESRRTERAYLSPEIVRQRRRTLELLAPAPGEFVVDIGCGPGLLALELSQAVGATGRVTGVDSSAAMIALAAARCGERDNIRLVSGDATALPLADASADVVCCTQVLLYVADHAAAIAEMFRVLRPGGRVLIMETDWRSTVLHSRDEALTEKIIEAWDRAVPSPRLPARLARLLRAAGFAAVAVDVIPNVTTECAKDGFSMSMMEQCARSAEDQGTISAAEARDWLQHLVELGARDEYFFCVNRFLFTAAKPGA